jgi:hypothetical protein
VPNESEEEDEEEEDEPLNLCEFLEELDAEQAARGLLPSYRRPSPPVLRHSAKSATTQDC